MRGSGDPQGPLLEVRGLGRRFGGLLALAGVSFAVPRGTVFGIIGPNGAGKTTLLNIISGFLLPDEGEVLLAGRPIQGLSPDRICRLGVTRTFQTIRIFKRMTALENVMVALESRERPGLAALLPRPGASGRARAEALELLASMGLEHRRDVRADQLPYGEQRRLEIARALASRPRLLLLDEPAAGMNEAESLALSEDILGLRDRGVTILVIEHDIALIERLSDRVLALNFGRPVAEGPPAEVLSHPDVVEAYLGT